MAVTSTPIMVQAVKTACIPIGATANANRDGVTGTYYGSDVASAVFAFGANGSLLESIKIHALTTTTAGIVRCFYAQDGTNFRLMFEMDIAAYTPSASV